MTTTSTAQDVIGVLVALRDNKKFLAEQLLRSLKADKGTIAKYPPR